VSRSGAGALSELAVCGTPAVLVPYPAAADHHQDANASAAASLAAAVIVHQHTPESPVLERTLWRLLGARLRASAPTADPLTPMGVGMQHLAVRDADQQVAQLITGLVNP
jgi:UDP-N-acetylglucosamine--N-acetylmuramyl-(pentapeptide) pyrophosphoryl-undecaprenol N-acetylglucosamine transferase